MSNKVAIISPVRNEKYLDVGYLSTKEITRIFTKIETGGVTGCWNWTGCRDKGGYARFWFRGRGSQIVMRVLYAWAVGPIPRGRGKDIPNLDHVVCDNESCCNPSHITLSTVRANTLRGSSPQAINSRKTHCLRGHPLPACANNPKRTKRECLTCRKERGAVKRSDPVYREQMKQYLREYHQRKRVA